LGRLHLKFFLKATATATCHGSALIPEKFNSDGFFPTFRAREKFWQTFLGDSNYFFPSSPHATSLYSVGYVPLIFMLALK